MYLDIVNTALRDSLAPVPASVPKSNCFHGCQSWAFWSKCCWPPRCGWGSRYKSLSPILCLTPSTWAEHQTTEQPSYMPNFHSEFGRTQWTLLLQGHAYVEEYIFPYLKYPRSQFSNVSMTSTYLHRSLRICGGRKANQHCLLPF